MRIYDLRSGAN